MLHFFLLSWHRRFSSLNFRIFPLLVPDDASAVAAAAAASVAAVVGAVGPLVAGFACPALAAAVAAVAVVVDALEEGVEHSGPRRGGREAAAAVAVLSPYGEKKSRVTLLVAARL